MEEKIFSKYFVEYAAKHTTLSDRELFVQFVDDYHLYDMIVPLMLEINQKRLSSLENKLLNIRTWVSLNYKHLFETYDLETALELQKIIRLYICNDKLEENDINWCKKNLPSLDFPEGGYYIPLLEYLGKMGILFKNTKMQNGVLTKI